MTTKPVDTKLICTGPMPLRLLLSLPRPVKPQNTRP